jgi:hypothetical protein
MLLILLSPLFYTKHIHLPTEHDLVPPQIQNNPKFWPILQNALGAVDGSHIHSAPPASEWPICWNQKGLYHKIAYLLAIFHFIWSFWYFWSSGWWGFLVYIFEFKLCNTLIYYLESSMKYKGSKKTFWPRDMKGIKLQTPRNYEDCYINSSCEKRNLHTKY